MNGNQTSGPRRRNPGWTRAATSPFRGAPPLADVLFVVVFLRLLHLGATAFFNDPGTGWHLRMGEIIVATGVIPTADSFSYTRAGAPWIDTQWLADAILCLTYHAGGYGLLALVTATLLAALFRWVYRVHATADGVPAVGLVMTLIASGAAAGQFLARPLLASTIGVPLSFWWATEYARGRCGAARLAVLVPMATVWCNLHPGVLGGIGTVGLVAAGTAVQALCVGAPARRNDGLLRAGVLAATAAAMAVATLVNPYGFLWHRAVTELTQMRALGEFVQEWMAPRWTDPDSLAVLVLLLAAVGGVSVKRGGLNCGEGLVLAGWLVQAAGHGRHLGIAGILLALQLARILGGVQPTRTPGGRWLARLVPCSGDLRVAERTAAGGVVSAVSVGGVLALLVAGIHVPWLGLDRAGPSSARFPAEAVRCLGAQRPARIFNDVDYGGTLIRDLPECPVFIDDRFELYGERFVAQYVALVRAPEQHARPLLGQWQINAALIGTNTMLERWLERQTDWSRVYRDSAVAVYTRRDPASACIP